MLCKLDLEELIVYDPQNFVLKEDLAISLAASKQLRWLLAGVGAIDAKALTIIASSPSIEVMYICSPDPNLKETEKSLISRIKKEKGRITNFRFVPVGTTYFNQDRVNVHLSHTMSNWFTY